MGGAAASPPYRSGTRVRRRGVRQVCGEPPVPRKARRFLMKSLANAHPGISAELPKEERKIGF